jgi:L-lactate dehydrogenase complex protein LldG
MSARDAFLKRVRQALAAGRRAGQAPTMMPRGSIGYEGAGADVVARFCTELTAARGQAHVVADRSAAIVRVVELARAVEARHILLGRGAFLDTLNLAEPLRSLGDVCLADEVCPDDDSKPLFAADLAVSGVEYLIAETGSLVVRAGPREPRSLTLLPPVHIAVAARSQLLPDLFDLFEPGQVSRESFPSCLTLITGPSKTGDIELRLVTGVHGPGTVHVVLVAE